ncbi:MAG: VOC family protein [Lachnospiraceae bacterium]|nr:VOC family protein [Lachnospiraceae bacterium]
MRVMGFNHIAVDSMDTERSRAFYEALGGKVIVRIPQPDGTTNYHIQLAVGANIEIQPPKSGKTSECAGWGHLAIQVDNCKEAYEVAIKAGATAPRPPMDVIKTMGSQQIKNAIVFGPDGEKIEFLELVY